MNRKFGIGDIVWDEASTDYYLIEDVTPKHSANFHYYWRNLCNGQTGFWEGALVDKYAANFHLQA